MLPKTWHVIYTFPLFRGTEATGTQMAWPSVTGSSGAPAIVNAWEGIPFSSTPHTYHIPTA